MDPVGRPSEEWSSEAVEFVRFCYRRRRTGWPELYDEMCAVARRGLYHGWTHEDLAERGIGFSLALMPALAGLVRRVVDEDGPRRRERTTCEARGVEPTPTPAGEEANEGPLVRILVGALA